MARHRTGWLGLGWTGGLLGLSLAGAGTTLAQSLPVATPLPPAVADTANLQLLRTAHGVRYVFHVRGTGALPQPGQRVTLGYTGFLPDGHIFDSSAGQGGLLKYRVGRREVIAGLDEVMPLLPVGSRARIWIPASLGYAAKGVPHPDEDGRYVVPPNTDLVFEVVIMSVR